MCLTFGFPRGASRLPFRHWFHEERAKGYALSTSVNFRGGAVFLKMPQTCRQIATQLRQLPGSLSAAKPESDSIISTSAPISSSLSPSKSQRRLRVRIRRKTPQASPQQTKTCSFDRKKPL